MTTSQGGAPGAPTDADLIREHLEALGLSQREAGRQLDIDERSMRYYCAGKQPVPSVVFLALRQLEQIRFNDRCLALLAEGTMSTSDGQLTAERLQEANEKLRSAICMLLRPPRSSASHAPDAVPGRAAVPQSQLKTSGTFERWLECQGIDPAKLTPEQLSVLRDGFTRTPQQLDESFKESYWHMAIEYGLQYYIAGRFAVHAQFTPVSANLLHHAVELLIKANLSRGDSPTAIRGYGHRQSYGHSLASAWQEFKRRNGDRAFGAHDAVVDELDKFEDVRYPDRLLDNGAMISIEIVEESPSHPSAAARPEPRYTLVLPQIDRLFGLLLERSGINREIFRMMLDQRHAATYHTLHNATPLL